MVPLYPTREFQVECVNPTRELKDGGLAKGTICTVYAMIPEQHVDGGFLIFFLVYSPAKNNFMLEPAWQFRPFPDVSGSSACPRGGCNGKKSKK